MELARWLSGSRPSAYAPGPGEPRLAHHFGTGLVKTPNDFGLNGEKPSNPELLDYLATAFLANGWRLKPLHRLILLSGSYRQAYATPESAKAQAKDPDKPLALAV
jgi:hypothetical protein